MSKAWVPVHAAVLVSLVLAMGLEGCSEEKGHREAPVLVSSAPGDTLVRTQGCPACREMYEVMGPEEFADDPHAFPCQTCHHPHTQKTAEGWRETCQSAGCHLRAWTKTRFHRVDPAAFVNCLNCHQPHIWRLEGNDCQSCHREVLESEAVAVSVVSGVESFSHLHHQNVGCVECHESSKKHGRLTLSTEQDCDSCHHSAASAASCVTCHSGREINWTRNRSVQLNLTAWDAPRTRSLAFDHARHSQLSCDQCHLGVGEIRVDCASCHDSHHHPEAACVSCHSRPDADAHTRAVHNSACSDCHGARGFEIMALTRNFCLSCHQDRQDHQEGKVCAGCHKISPAMGVGQ